MLFPREKKMTKLFFIVISHIFLKITTLVYIIKFNYLSLGHIGVALVNRIPDEPCPQISHPLSASCHHFSINFAIQILGYFFDFLLLVFHYLFDFVLKKMRNFLVVIVIQSMHKHLFCSEMTDIYFVLASGRYFALCE